MGNNTPPPKVSPSWRWPLLAFFVVVNVCIFAWLRSGNSMVNLGQEPVSTTAEASSLDDQDENKSSIFRLKRPQSVDANLSDDEYRKKLLSQDVANVAHREEAIRREREVSLPLPQRDAKIDAKKQLTDFIRSNQSEKHLSGLVAAARKQLEQIDNEQH